jgi:SAM-dependent methyltransferase
LIAEFDDPRLVAVYDTINAYGPGEQPDFYASVAADAGAVSIVELGCGTGMVAGALAARGHRVTGVDPSAAMLAVARTRPRADEVQWICGDAGALDASADAFDLAFMSGHVAQFFVTDESWAIALSALYRALRPGGCLAFESRNPAAREWERWTRPRARVVEDVAAGTIETWTEVDDVTAGVVTYRNHYRFARTGAELVSHAQLRFRPQRDLRASLATAGFTVDVVYGDWDRNPVAPSNPELIFVARRD